GADAIVVRAGRSVAGSHGPTLALKTVGHGRAVVELDGETFELSPRHSEIVALLIAHPEGLTSRELARELYGPGGKRVTVRAEMSRLRRVLGPVMAPNPYRLDPQRGRPLRCNPPATPGERRHPGPPPLASTAPESKPRRRRKRGG